MTLFHSQLAWVADGYRVESRPGSRRSAPSVVSVDSIALSVENGSTTSDAHRNVFSSRGAAQRRRVRSAIQRRAQERHHDEPPAPPASTPTKRPQFRRPYSASVAVTSQPRPFSGRSVSSSMTQGAPRKPTDYHKSYTMVNRWLQEWKFQSQVMAGPGPCFPDRHARCHGNDHMHGKLYQGRPQTACQDCRTEGPALRTFGQPKDSVYQQEFLTVHSRYQSVHRPRTAPVTRSERQILTKHNHVLRGDAPHFCNFVSRSHMWEKQYPPPPPVTHSYIQLKYAHHHGDDVIDLETAPTDEDAMRYGSVVVSDDGRDMSPPTSIHNDEQEVLDGIAAENDPSNILTSDDNLIGDGGTDIPAPQSGSHVESPSNDVTASGNDVMPTDTAEKPKFAWGTEKQDTASPILNPSLTRSAAPASPRSTITIPTAKPESLPDPSPSPKSDTGSKPNSQQNSRTCGNRLKKADVKRQPKKPLSVTSGPATRPKMESAKSTKTASKPNKTSEQPTPKPVSLVPELPKQRSPLEQRKETPQSRVVPSSGQANGRGTPAQSKSSADDASAATGSGSASAGQGPHSGGSFDPKANEILDAELKASRREVDADGQKMAAPASVSEETKIKLTNHNPEDTMVHLNNIKVFIDTKIKFVKWKNKQKHGKGRAILKKHQEFLRQLLRCSPDDAISHDDQWDDYGFYLLSSEQINVLGGKDVLGRVVEGYNKEPKSKPQRWTFGRLALSQQSSRFELPMDMKTLETMGPQDYLRQHCIISSRRLELYHRTFITHKDRSGHMSYKDLEKAIKGVLVNTIDQREVEDIFKLVQVDDDTKIDFKLFSGLAAVAERILYPKFLTTDTEDMKDHKKEKIECADFCSLKWKFHGVNVNPPVRKILETL